MDDGFGADRLKTELTLDGFAGLAEEIVVGCGESRSSRPLELLAIEEAVTGFMAELKSPKPSEALLVLRSAAGWFVVLLELVCLGGGLGDISKKPPPPSGEVTCGGAGAAR